MVTLNNDHEVRNRGTQPFVLSLPSSPEGGPMLEQEEAYAAHAVTEAVRAMGLEMPAKGIAFRNIPDQWGVGTAIAMQLAGKDRARVAEIAEGIAAHLRALDHFAEVQVTNGYVNCIFDVSKVATAVVRSVLAMGADYGRGAPVGERVMIEYAQPNTHKEFHVGHLRNTVLGAALVRIMRFAGYEVVAASYPGDIGAHVIRCLWCYREFHAGEEPAAQSERGRWLGDLYVESTNRLAFRKDIVDFIAEIVRDDLAFANKTDVLMRQLIQQGVTSGDVSRMMAVLVNHKAFAVESFTGENTVPAFWKVVGQELRTELLRHPEDPATAVWCETYQRLDATFDAWWVPSEHWEADVRTLFAAWDRKDPDVVALWERTRQWSLDEFHRIFAQLGVPIDVYFFESEVEEPGRAIVQDLLERGIAEVSDGLPVVKIDEKLGLGKEMYRVLPILRSDGTTLYATKDLALAQVKFDEYHIDRSVYVIDARQGPYMQQLFKVLELMGFPQASKCFHLSYELVRLPEGLMSSRSGNAVRYDDVANEVLRRARAAVEEKNPELPEETKAAVAQAVGLGAIIYGMVDRDNNKEITFDWETALSFDGHAAPYIQYAHARACRILERAARDGIALPDATSAVLLPEPAPEELALLAQIGDFPTEVRRAAEGYKPLTIANYVYDLATRFADFYQACPVLQVEDPARAARLALVAATAQVLMNGLALLGIHAPDAM